MRRGSFLGTLLTLAGLPARSPAQPVEKGAAELIVTGATIHTVDDAFANPQAFAVRAGRFAYVGSAGGAMSLRGPETVVLDLRGQTVLPGLIDAHLHLTSVGLDLNEVVLDGLRSYDEVVARTVAFARTSPDAWIQGDGWDQNLWPGQAFPDHELLSAALPDRPVALSRVDGHAVLANAKAMALAGVGASTPDPPGGRIVRDAQGNPTGVFVDNAQGLIYRAVPVPSHAQLVRATRAAIAECNRWGLTTVSEPGIDAAGIAAHRELLEAGTYDIRNHAMLRDEGDLLATYLPKGPSDGEYDGRFSIRTVKLYADGALGSRGAALLAPYSDDPQNDGLVIRDAEYLQNVTQAALRSGFQVCVHAIGDRGNRNVLDAYEAALAAVPTRDARLRVEHAQVLAPEDIPRFAKLGIIPSMQTTHQISDMGWAQERLGPERVLGAYAWRSLLDTGVIIANGTDAPVERVSTLRTFHAAISRQNEANEPPGGWYPHQRMTRDEALKSMTIWAAHANFQERIVGSISPGKYADFVVLDRDWMTVAPEDVMGTNVAATYLAGKRVYDGSHGTAYEPRARRPHKGCC